MSALLLAALLAATAATTGEDAVTERVLIDFAAPGAAEAWRPVHDVVMGGESRGGLTATDQGTAVFAGALSLANRGGFASVRTRPGDYGFAGGDALAVRALGDGRRYQLRLRTDDAFDGVAYRAFFTPPAGEWADIRIPFSDFESSFRGRPVPGAPALDPAAVRSVGLLLADGQAGPFRLEVARIVAYRPVPDIP